MSSVNQNPCYTGLRPLIRKSLFKRADAWDLAVGHKDQMQLRLQILTSPKGLWQCHGPPEGLLAPARPAQGIWEALLGDLPTSLLPRTSLMSPTPALRPPHIRTSGT